MSYEFINAAQEHGLIIDHIIEGRWVRVPTEDHPHSKNGAYFFAGEFGHIQNWATMEKTETWFTNKVMTPVQREALMVRIQKSRDDERQIRIKKMKDAAKRAEWILSQCELDKHAYLDSKGFPDLTGNVWRKEGAEPLLVIPMMHREWLVGVQLIDIHGDKKFLSGQRTNDTSFQIGRGSKVFLCEGYATGLSLQALLAALKVDYTIHVCFSAGNVARWAKNLPNAFLVCDNDVSGTGQKVGAESGCKWWMSPIEGEDINDLQRRVGKFTASQMLKKELM